MFLKNVLYASNYKEKSTSAASVVTYIYHMYTYMQKHKTYLLYYIMETKRSNIVEDINAVTTPVAAPIAKDPLNIPRNIPIDLNIAAMSNV